MTSEDDLCFLDGSDSPQPVEVNEFLQKLRKLFVVIDAVVKSVIVSPEINARRAQESNSATNVQRCKEHEKTTVDASVQDCKECKKLQEQPVPEPAKDDFFDKPD